MQTKRPTPTGRGNPNDPARGVLPFPNETRLHSRFKIGFMPNPVQKLGQYHQNPPPPITPSGFSQKISNHPDTDRTVKPKTT